MVAAIVERVAAEIAAHGPVPGAETAAPGDMPGAETAAPGDVPGVETAAPGASPVAEAAPPDPDQAGETVPAPAALGISPAPMLPGTRASGAFRTTMMELPMTQATKATETMMKAAEEAVEFGRGNVEALTKATQIYVAGVQDLGKMSFAVMQGMADHAIESAKALSGVKSLQEAMQIQSSYARAAIEKSVSESAKFGESALKLTEQTFAPITARMSLAAEKITKVPAVA
jgi:phasin family protein